jgi:diguanylate cyclase (GGDEF)-like protein
VTASFGVTTYQAGQTLEESIHAADQALYQAKQNGRNQVVVYTAEDSPDTV